MRLGWGMNESVARSRVAGGLEKLVDGMTFLLRGGGAKHSMHDILCIEASVIPIIGYDR